MLEIGVQSQKKRGGNPKYLPSNWTWEVDTYNYSFKFFIEGIKSEKLLRFLTISTFSPTPHQICTRLNFDQNSSSLIYRVFCLDSTPFTPPEQHKLNSCSLSCLSKTLQGLCCRYLNFVISKNLERFLKNFN